MIVTSSSCDKITGLCPILTYAEVAEIPVTASTMQVYSQIVEHMRVNEANLIEVDHQSVQIS